MAQGDKVTWKTHGHLWLVALSLAVIALVIVGASMVSTQTTPQPPSQQNHGGVFAPPAGPGGIGP